MQTGKEVTISYGAESVALRQRVTQLTQGRSQSEIARKTGTSVANVNRYLKGTRMPAEFCAALVKGLGVNPAWLLAGEGTPFVSDITASTASMGGNLLELVEALNAVSQMRLGALTGKHHLKVLRELNDAMQTYERLRQKLNAHSEPIFRQLLTDLARVLDKFETDRGREIMKATEQVARLCDNALLTRQLLRLQAQLKFLEGDHVRALGFQRQLMLHPLAGGEIVNDENLQTVYRLVLTLHTLNQHAEALRVCDAAIALMPPESKDWPFYPMLAFMRGRLKAELGDLVEGLSIMVQHAPKGNERLQRALKFWLTGHLLRAGLLSRKDAFAYGEDMSPKGVMLLDFACAMEDPAYLKQACDFALDEKQAKLGDLSRPPLYGPILLRAMTRHDKHAPAEFKSMLPKFVDDYAALPEIFTCQLWRMLENRKAARAEFEAAQGRLNALPKGRWVDVLTRAIHHKNALWLGANETSGPLAQARDKAKTFFEEHIAKGFVCLKGLPS